ncbi:MAG: BREX system ATP-binding domain-containing protein, partial [Candidatus Limnocylindrales bacterium]
MATTDWTCPHCGGSNPDGMRFCGHCGKPREAAAEPTAAEPTAADSTAAEPTAADSTAADSTAADPTLSIGSALREHVSVDTASRFVDERGAYAEDLRLITSLFADISGFTALAQRVDTEELLEIIDPLVARLGAIVARFEGTVEKYAGDAILAVFGAPVAHEDDAARAMIVALEMHRELDRCVLDLGPGAEGLTLHVGINSGHAIARVMGSEGRLDYGVLGDSVILAQRLEAHAKGGETLVGASTVELVGERFVLEPIGELTVKGKAEPVAAWRLIGERRRPATAVHEVRASFPDPTPDLIGREAEIRTLTESIDRLGRGRGRLVRVTGEPGSGKSTLVEAMQRIASARGVRWLETRSLSYGRSASYGPFAELVREWAGVEPAEPQASVMRRLALATTRAGIARFT